MQYTALHSLHVELQAKLGEFAGYSMPLWYPEKIISEHLHTRSSASLFDISHMAQLQIHGKSSAAELERLIPANLLGLHQGKIRYCCLTNDQGGIIDDLMVTNLDEDNLYLVLNASRKSVDLDHLKTHFPADRLQLIEDRALLALQGPEASNVLCRLSPGTEKLSFMSMMTFNILGAECYVSRCGYTGEDGFEISVPVECVEELAREMLSCPEVKPAGLGARDSLRLEAGLSLYGQELTEDTTPVEAGIHWTISPLRRKSGAREGGFPGADIILHEIENGAKKSLVGLRLKTKFPARTGAKICLAEDQIIGEITSGVFSPTLKMPIAMGYIEQAHLNSNTPVFVLVRNKLHPAELVTIPFVPHNYYRKQTKH